MLYTEIESYIKKYTKTADGFDWEVFLDGLEDTVQKLYPEDKVDIWTYEIDNGTFRVDRAFNDILDFTKNHTIVSYSTNWDDCKENLIITIIHRG